MINQDVSLQFKKYILDTIIKEGNCEVTYVYDLPLKQVMQWFFELKMSDEELFKLAISLIKKCDLQDKEILLLKSMVRNLQNRNAKDDEI